MAAPSGEASYQRQTMRNFADPQVAAVFKSYPPGLRTKLMTVRELVFDVAARTDGVGPLTETLKWGQPSYLTDTTRSGSTVRLDRLKSGDGYAIYVHCQSGLIEAFRELGHCIGLALTHHLRKKSKRRK